MRLLITLAAVLAITFLVFWLLMLAWNNGPAQAFTFCREIDMLETVCLWLTSLAFSQLIGGGLGASNRS